MLCLLPLGHPCVNIHVYLLQIRSPLIQHFCLLAVDGSIYVIGSMLLFQRILLHTNLADIQPPRLQADL